eukprot:scaffold91687_cov21-Phaeocystis_antarctica.AAC.1
MGLTLTRTPHPHQAEFVAALLSMASPEQVPKGFGGVDIPGCSSEALCIRGGDVPKGERERILHARSMRAAAT